MNKKPKTPFEQWLNYLKYQRRNCVDTIKFNEVLFKQVLKVREDEQKNNKTRQLRLYKGGIQQVQQESNAKLQYT